MGALFAIIREGNINHRLNERIINDEKAYEKLAIILGHANKEWQLNIKSENGTFSKLIIYYRSKQMV